MPVFTLPPGTYFVGDAAHLYYMHHVKFPLVDEEKEECEELIDWFSSSLTFDHENKEHNMYGLSTGAESDVQFNVQSVSVYNLSLPNHTLFVIPERFFPSELVNQCDPLCNHHFYVTTRNESKLTIECEDWLHSKGCMVIETENTLLVMQHGQRV